MMDILETLEGFTKAYDKRLYDAFTDDELKQHGLIISRAGMAMGNHLSPFFQQAIDKIRLQSVEINYLKCGIAETLESEIKSLRQKLAVIEDGLDADKAMTKALAQVDANTIAGLKQQLADQPQEVVELHKAIKAIVTNVDFVETDESMAAMRNANAALAAYEAIDSKPKDKL